MTGCIQLFLKKFVQTALAHVESTRQILHANFFQKMLIQIADDLIGLIGFNLNKFVGIFQGIVNDFYQKTGGCTTGIGFRKLPIRSIFPVKGFILKTDSLRAGSWLFRLEIYDFSSHTVIKS